MDFTRRLKSESVYLTNIVRCLRRVTAVARDRGRTYPDVIEDLARRHGDRPALLSHRETFTFRDYDERANRYARWARANGVGRGDVLGLLMPNRPEYLAIWLGVARAGGVTALLNTSQTGSALAHSVNIVRPLHVIVAAELDEAWRSAAPYLESGPRLWSHGAVPMGRAPRIDEAVEALPGAPLDPAERVALTTNDPCLYIYTSGTTGQPKAANINHHRVQAMTNAFAGVMRTGPRDRTYVCLPMYHSNGGVLAIGSHLIEGGSAFIAERFSTSAFWTDVVDNDCTTFVYVGELCRYLLNAPHHPKEGLHRLRIACGNGLRPDIWVDFRERFRIPRLVEFYGATEGNAVLFNFDATPGAVGRVPAWLRHRFPMKLVRYDVASETHLRGPDGFCLTCGPDEIGELISEIIDDPLKPAQRFEGYADHSADEQKILRDVFRRGDRWFRTGDLLRQDRAGNFYFVDRIGDTFRWKSENVATSQIAELLSGVPGVTEANVYGVTVNGTEGRAGMAAIVADETLDLNELRRVAHGGLPPFARPVFLRFLSRMDITGTFKMRKVDLVTQGFDPARTTDPIYFDNPETGDYELVDAALYQRIQSGGIRL